MTTTQMVSFQSGDERLKAHLALAVDLFTNRNRAVQDGFTGPGGAAVRRLRAARRHRLLYGRRFRYSLGLHRR